MHNLDMQGLNFEVTFRFSVHFNTWYAMSECLILGKD